MSTYQFSNNASSLLAAAVSDTETILQVSLGDGVKFPTPNATLGLVFAVTLQDSSGDIEVCLCTSRTADELTVVRGQEGTLARAWNPIAGAVRVELRLTQGTMESLLATQVAYLAGGSGVSWKNDAGQIDASILGLEDPARAGKLLLQLLGTGAAAAVKSLIELKVNDVVWPLATASRTEGYVPELDSSTDTLVWMPRGALVINEADAPMQRRPTVKYAGGVAVTDDGSRTVVTILPAATIGEVRTFAGSTLPSLWRACDGAVLDASAGTGDPALQPLFDVIGTTYGGNDNTDFQLPDLRGRVAIGTGQGSGLTDRQLGASLGAETHILDISEMPVHNHLQDQGPAGSATPASAGFTTGITDGNANSGIKNAGGDQPHNNMQPSLALTVGIYAGA